tara:strand:- start:531 stop:665 length:135 start_codon:yes stop_codon:yes gene_type:complete
MDKIPIRKVKIRKKAVMTLASMGGIYFAIPFESIHVGSSLKPRG